MDGLDVVIAGGAGAVSEVAKFGKFLTSPTGEKIVEKLFEVGLSVVESSLKIYLWR